jgi:hypothetical protein
MESSSSSDNGSSQDEFVTEFKETNELVREADDDASNSLYTFKSRMTITLPPDAASLQMSRSASAPQIHRGADELSAFLRVDGADGTLYHQQAISEAGNASLGCLESPTPNDELAEFDKRSAAATTRTTLGRSVNIHNSSLLCVFPVYRRRKDKSTSCAESVFSAHCIPRE